MELLDAGLAFALTLAALATVVTILLETCHRALGIRRRNLAQVLRLLNDELGRGIFGLTAEQRWDFVANTLRNPAVSAYSIPTAAQVAAGARPTRTAADSVFLALAWLVRWLPGTARARRLLDVRRAAGKLGAPGDDDGWLLRIAELTTVNLKAGAYDRVSAEHVLRRLNEMAPVREMAEHNRAAVEAEYDRLARKFEEFTSAVSADFKRRSQTYSIVIGILLALVVNIDGLRIFDTFRTNPAVAQVIAAQEGQIRATYEASAARIAALNDLREQISQRQAALKIALDDEKPKILTEIDTLIAEQAAGAEWSKIGATADHARTLLADLRATGLPIGARFFPHCRLESGWLTRLWDFIWQDESASRPATGACLDAVTDSGLMPWLQWFFAALVTGALIGLGAPFWFDVARRLAEVRAMFGGKASGEARFSGRDANADPSRRRAIVKQVLDDIAPGGDGAKGAVG